MKEFEKWYKKNLDLGLYCTDAEDGWKAALEWIYIEVTGTDLSTMRDMINEELL